MNKLKKVFLCAILSLFAIILTGCGAKVSTTLSIDKEFNGQRIMTCTLSNENVSKYITGGLPALEETVKKYIPSPLTYTLKTDETNSVLTFTMNFNGIDDYKTKMNTVFSVDPGYNFEPDIKHEHSDSPFSARIYFEENFNSIDTLAWFKYGLRTDGIINSNDSESDWFEISSNKIIYNGTEYNSSQKLKISESFKNLASSTHLTTTFLSNGNFDRTIKISFSTSTLTNLSADDFDVSAFLNELLSEGAVLTDEVNDDYKTYIISLSNCTANQIESATKKIFIDETAIFKTEVKSDINNKDKVIISVSDNAIPTYYLGNSYSSTNATSKFYLFDNTKIIESDTSYKTFSYTDDDGNKYFYHNLDENPYEIDFSWTISYQDITLLPEVSGEKFGIGISFAIPQDILPIAKDIAYNRLVDSLPKEAKINETTENGMIVYTIDFGLSDNETIENAYKTFMLNLTGEKSSCSLSHIKLDSGSPFKKVYAYEMVIDTYALTGSEDTNIIFKTSNASEIKLTENSNIVLNSSNSDETAETPVTNVEGLAGTYSNGKAKFGFATQKVNILGYIGVAVLVIAIISLILVIVLSLNLFKPALAKLMASKPKLPATKFIATTSQETTKALTQANSTSQSETQIPIQEETREEEVEEEEEFI